jgi:hypothetical protein
MKQFPQMQTIMFVRRHNFGSISLGFWVNCGPSDVTDADFKPQGALCLLKFDNYYSSFKEMLTKNDACVRDPCISFDAKKVVFAMSGSGKGTGYRLFEMKIGDSSSIKQLTFNPVDQTVADIEPCYVPNGDIVFASTRCFGAINAGWQPITNMFAMDSTGKYIRRLGYDQAHTFYPVLRPDGSVMYSRWEFNDRDFAQIMGLFSMYPDGCHQTEIFGNQTAWPSMLQQGRPVPGSPTKFFAVTGGHHGDYSGEALVADILKSSNGPENIAMISPPRTTESRETDIFAFGGGLRNSEYPYPLSDRWYLVSYRDEIKLNTMSYIHSSGIFRIYLKNVDGKGRELLAWADQSLHSPVVVAPWKEIWGSDPVKIAQQANYNDSMGTFTMSNVYYGAGTKGIEKGVAKKLRVVALRYRVLGACENGWAGQVSGAKPPDVVFSAPNVCPVALWGGSWDVKEVLGEAKIYEDGSASFKVPARTPVYFQVLDSNGCQIADMRSWATLMPGEKFSCYGCHEGKSESPPPVNSPQAVKSQMLDTPLGVENQGFDYPKFVQPIFDRNCIGCHKANHSSGFDLTGDLVMNSAAKKSFAKSYASLFVGIGASKSNKAINLATIFSPPQQMPPYSYGSTQSGLMKAVNGSVAAMKDVQLTDKEKRILACWIDLEAPHSGRFNSYMSAADSQKYVRLEETAKKWYDIEAQNVKDLARLQAAVAVPERGVKPGVVAGRLGIGYLPAKRALALKNYYKGNLVLTDIRGRVVCRLRLSDPGAFGTATLLLPASLSPGLYLAALKGEKGISQARFSITRK